MLKPRRKIIKKELKRDPYIEFLASAKDNLDKKSVIISKIILGFAIIFCRRLFNEQLSRY